MVLVVVGCCEDGGNRERSRKHSKSCSVNVCQKKSPLSEFCASLLCEATRKKKNEPTRRGMGTELRPIVRVSRELDLTALSRELDLRQNPIADAPAAPTTQNLPPHGTTDPPSPFGIPLLISWRVASCDTMSPRSQKSTVAKPTAKRRLAFDEPEKEPRPKKAATAVDPTTETTTPLSSPPRTSRTTKRSPAAVTPEDTTRTTAKQTSKSAFVPKYIHKNLGYQTAGTAGLAPAERTAYAKIVATHTIPADIERPKSGTCYEHCVLRAYHLGRLKVRGDTAENTRFCTACGATGHVRFDCPTLI